MEGGQTHHQGISHSSTTPETAHHHRQLRSAREEAKHRNLQAETPRHLHLHGRPSTACTPRRTPGRDGEGKPETNGGGYRHSVGNPENEGSEGRNRGIITRGTESRSQMPL